MPSFLRRRCRLSQRDLTPGSYLTDGRNLFRVISQFVNGRSVLMRLEHCVTLEARPRAASELEAMGMRAVGNTRARRPAAIIQSDAGWRSGGTPPLSGDLLGEPPGCHGPD